MLGSAIAPPVLHVRTHVADIGNKGVSILSQVPGWGVGNGAGWALVCRRLHVSLSPDGCFNLHPNTAAWHGMQAAVASDVSPSSSLFWVSYETQITKIR